MGKIFKGQTELRINVELGINLSSAASVLLKYKKPSGNSGYWVATIASAPAGTIHYDIVSADDLNESGDWKFWGAVRFDDGDYAPGEATKRRVYDEGDE